MINGTNGNPDIIKQINELKHNIEKELELKKDNEPWSGKGASNSLNRQPKVVRTLKGHFGKIYSLDWGTDKPELDYHPLVSASQDGKLFIWNAMTTNKVQAIPLRSSWVMTCAFEKENNNLVCCGGLDNTGSVYKLGTEGGFSVTRPHVELTGHDGYLSCCRFMNERELITSSGDGLCIQWDVENSKMIHKFNDHEGDVMSVALKPGSPYIFVSGSTDATSILFDTRQKEKIFQFRSHESDVNSVSFFPDGNAFGSGSDDMSCILTDLRAWKDIYSYGKESIVCGVTSVDFSKSGRILFAGYENYDCFGWDITNKDSEISLKNHENRCSTLQVNPSGTALATGSWDTTMKIHG